MMLRSSINPQDCQNLGHLSPIPSGGLQVSRCISVVPQDSIQVHFFKLIDDQRLIKYDPNQLLVLGRYSPEIWNLQRLGISKGAQPPIAVLTSE